MSNLSLVIGLSVGTLGFLFLFWRRLKEDYASKQIFSFGFLVILFIQIGFLLSLIFNIRYQIPGLFFSKGIWFWASFIFGIFGFIFAYTKFKLRFFETMESAGLGFLFWFFVICLTNSINMIDLKLFIFALLLLGIILLFFFLDSRYKNYVWYKSGKVGFAGLSILGIFFLMRSMVALVDPPMLSFIDKSDAILDSIASFAFFISLYNLSEL